MQEKHLSLFHGDKSVKFFHRFIEAAASSSHFSELVKVSLEDAEVYCFWHPRFWAKVCFKQTEKQRKADFLWSLWVSSELRRWRFDRFLYFIAENHISEVLQNSTGCDPSIFFLQILCLQFPDEKHENISRSVFHLHLLLRLNWASSSMAVCAYSNHGRMRRCFHMLCNLWCLRVPPPASATAARQLHSRLHLFMHLFPLSFSVQTGNWLTCSHLGPALTRDALICSPVLLVWTLESVWIKTSNSHRFTEHLKMFWAFARSSHKWFHYSVKMLNVCSKTTLNVYQSEFSNNWWYFFKLLFILSVKSSTFWSFKLKSFL